MYLLSLNDDIVMDSDDGIVMEVASEEDSGEEINRSLLRRGLQ